MDWKLRKEMKDAIAAAKDKVEIDVHSLHGKTVIIRVQDPQGYAEGTGKWTTKFLQGAGAASVIVCKPEDKIEVMDDAELAKVGLKRI